MGLLDDFRGVVFVVALIAVTAVVGRYGGAVFGRDGSSAPPAPTLADRLNGACGSGYRMTDWSTTDELGYALGDTVMVECSSVREDRYGLPVRVYRLAVAR